MCQSLLAVLQHSWPPEALPPQCLSSSPPLPSLRLSSIEPLFLQCYDWGSALNSKMGVDNVNNLLKLVQDG